MLDIKENNNRPIKEQEQGVGRKIQEISSQVLQYL